MPKAGETILTPELIEALCADIAMGLPKEKMCWKHGISDSALYEWIAKGNDEASEALFRSLVESIKKAETAFLESVRQGVMKEPKDWTRWAWLGERLQPQVFGKVDRAQIEIRDGRAGGVLIPGKSE